MAKLRYDWAGPIGRLETEPQPYSVRRLTPVISMAWWFLDNWADFAELAGMQPVHLLKNDPTDPMGRGLAWRWTDNMDVLCFPRRNYICADAPRTTFVYRFDRDGRTPLVVGDERREIMGSQIELLGQDSVRRRALMSSVVPDLQDIPNG